MNTNEHQTTIFSAMLNRATALRSATFATIPLFACWDRSGILARIKRYLFGDSSVWGTIERYVLRSPDAIGIAADHVVVANGSVIMRVQYDSVPGLAESAFNEIVSVLRAYKSKPAVTQDEAIYSNLFLTALKSTKSISEKESNILTNKIGALNCNPDMIQHKVDGYSYSVREHVLSEDVMRVDGACVIKPRGIGANLLGPGAVLTFNGVGKIVDGKIIANRSNNGEMMLALASLCFHGHASLSF